MAGPVHPRGRSLGRGVALSALALVAVLSSTSTPAFAEVATATITGHVTTEAPGAVTVSLFTTAGIAASQVVSDSDGDYALSSVPSGDYKMYLRYAGRAQWAHQKLGFSTATVITVGQGDHVVVDETMLLPGVVEVHATDAVTGLPVDSYCLSLWETTQQRCGATDGVMRFDEFTEGPRTVYVTTPDGLHARQSIANVSVTLGQVKRLDVTLTPTAAITTTVVDRASGEPVADVCVVALPLVFGAFDDEACQWGTAEYTDAEGRITLGELAQNDYTLLVVPQDGVHGIQWLGDSGGVGSQYLAAMVHTAAGSLATAPQVKLDPAASITGVIKDAVTGEPVSDGCASVLPKRIGRGIGSSCSDGTYTLSDLGPYAWPIQFSNFYAWSGDPYVVAWSGGAGDRRAATLVQAGIDQPGTQDATIAKADAPMTLKVSSQDGQIYTGWFSVDIYQDRTGDLVRTTDTNQGWTIRGVGDQQVRIHYSPDSPWKPGWYGGHDFATARTVSLRVGQTTTVKIVLPDPA